MQRSQYTISGPGPAQQTDLCTGSLKIPLNYRSNQGNNIGGPLSDNNSTNSDASVSPQAFKNGEKERSIIENLNLTALRVNNINTNINDKGRGG